MITLEELRHIMSYDTDSGIFTWTNPTSNRVKAGSQALCKDAYGYVVIRLKGRLYKAHRLAWFYVYGHMPTEDIDHINGIRDDNRIANLRVATSQENNRNKKIQKNNTTGFIGVSYKPDVGKYRATITVNKTTIHIGYYSTPEEASKAYQIKAAELFGEYKHESNNNLS